jgi:hypothetical protein
MKAVGYIRVSTNVQAEHSPHTILRPVDWSCCLFRAPSILCPDDSVVPLLCVEIFGHKKPPEDG